MLTKCFLVCAILLIVQYGAYGLNCYNCVAGTDGCGTNFNSKGAGITQISDSTSDGCLKTISTSNGNSIGRGNGAACSSPTTISASDGVDGSTTYCCTTDLCNGSIMKAASVSFAFALVALIFFYKM